MAALEELERPMGLSAELRKHHFEWPVANWKTKLPIPIQPADSE